MKTHSKMFFVLLSALAVLLGADNASLGAVTFTNTPAAVSNTYSGYITLQIGGLPNHEPVVIQKFLDANTNGVVDAGDLLWQQFNLTDGTNFVVSGVTNNNVPGDLNSATGAITANLNFQADFLQTVAGKYLFVLSSPSGHFTPITNSFTVTTFPYAQKFTGTVVSNGVAVPNAVVILFPSTPDSNPLGGTVANNSGIYTLPAAAGSYSLVPFKTNFVANFGTAPVLTLSNSVTFTNNLSLIAATQTISGKVVDAANSSIGLPGILVPVSTQDRSLLALCFTDTNGNFSTRVNANQWKIEGDSAGPALHGYLTLQNKTTVDTTTGSVANVTIALPKATALFYGSVKDNFGKPLPGVVAVYANDNNNGLYEADGYTDTNGNYVTAAVGGLGSNDPWTVSIDNSSSFTNYVFSQSQLQQNGNGGTNMAIGNVVLQNFTAILATNRISGNVKFNGTNVVGVGVNASMTTNGLNYYVNNVDTDTNGNYSFNVASGDWSVNIDENSGDSDSLESVLGNNNYLVSDNSNVNINNSNAPANFNVIVATGSISGNVQDSNGDPISGVGVFAYAMIGGVQYDAYMDTDGGGHYSLNVANGNWTVGVNQSGNNDSLDNILGAGNYQYPGSQNVNINNSGGTANFTVQLCNGVQIITTSPLSDGQIGNSYYTNLQATSCNDSFTWTLNDPIDFPPGLNFDSAGEIFGTPTTPGTYNFSVHVTDGVNSTDQSFTLTIDGTLQPLQVTTTSLFDGMVSNSYSQPLDASGGVPPYSWSLTPGSLALPSGLSMDPSSGAITGTPSSAAIGTNYFEVRVTDSQTTTADMFLSIVVYPTTLITNVSLPNGTNGLPYSVAFGVTGGAGSSYGWQFYSGTPPNGISIGYASGIISGTPTQTGTFSFTVGAIDGGYSFQHAYSLTILPNILQITTASLSNATVSVAYTNQLQGSGGVTPYIWTIANGSQPLPPALTLTTNGLISGVPSAIGVKSFIVRLTDQAAQTVTRSFTLAITPILDTPVWQTNQFQMRLTGFATTNYTLQSSTSLTNWTTLFITNNATTNTYFLTDPNATNQHRFYRILIGP
jgi:hypothetical protein